MISSGIKTATFRLVAQCLNKLRHCMPLTIDSVISTFCSLLFYGNFGPLLKFLYSALSVINDFLSCFLCLILARSFTNFNVLESKG